MNGLERINAFENGSPVNHKSPRQDARGSLLFRDDLSIHIEAHVGRGKCDRSGPDEMGFRECQDFSLHQGNKAENQKPFINFIHQDNVQQSVVRPGFRGDADTAANDAAIGHAHHKSVPGLRFAVSHSIGNGYRMETQQRFDDAVQIGKQAAAVFFGFQRVVQNGNVKACADLIEEQASVDFTDIGGLRRVGKDKRQCVHRVFRQADGFDKVVSCSRWNNAERALCSQQSLSYLQRRAVSADGQHGFRAMQGGVMRQSRGMAWPFRPKHLKRNICVPELLFYENCGFFALSAAGDRIVNSTDHENAFILQDGFSIHCSGKVIPVRKPSARKRALRMNGYNVYQFLRFVKVFFPKPPVSRFTFLRFFGMLIGKKTIRRNRAMNIGIRLHDTRPGTLEERLAFAKAQGFSCVHLAMSKAVSGFSMKDAPALLTEEMAERIRDALASQKMECAVLGCYLKLADPDEERFQQTLRIYQAHLRFARLIGARAVGTETPPAEGNVHSEEAYQLLLRRLQPVVRMAEEENVPLAVEPVFEHILSTPEKAERLLDAFSSPYLRIILDAVNLLGPAQLPCAQQVIADAVHRLGGRTIVLHMKDYLPLQPGEKRPRCVACGLGEMRYDTILRLALKNQLPMTLENTTPENAEGARLHLETLAESIKENCL